MKIFAIRDESAVNPIDLAYLLYYESEKRFYIELPENADPWETPLLLSSFIKKGETSVNSYWSNLWVQQRIVPPDRQNLGQVLKDNHLNEYDEFDLLMLSMGKCAQDDYYLVPIEEKQISSQIQKRFARRIENVVPLENYELLVFFRDGTVKNAVLRNALMMRRLFRYCSEIHHFFTPSLSSLEVMVLNGILIWASVLPPCTESAKRCRCQLRTFKILLCMEL